MRRGLLGATIAAAGALALLLAGTGTAQTTPDARVDVTQPTEPLPPEQATLLAVTATVSCEAWTPSGTETVASFSMPALPDGYEATFEPRQVVIDPGPSGCPAGQRVTARTQLALEPGVEADAGGSYSYPVSLDLEERVGETVVRDHGPFSDQVEFTTGLAATLDADLRREALDGSAGEPLEAVVDVDVTSNGQTDVRLEVLDVPDHVSVDVREDLLRLDEDGTGRFEIRLEARNPNPFAATSAEVPVRVTLTEPGVTSGEPTEGTRADDRLSVRFDPAVQDPATAIPATLALALVAAVPAVVRRYESAAQASGETLDTEGVLARGVLLAGGVLAAFALVTRRPDPGVAAAGLLVAGLWLRTRPGRLGTDVHLDHAGTAAIALGTAGLLGAHALEAYGLFLAGLLSILAGGWLLIERWLSRWATAAYIGTAVLVVLAPLLEGELVLGAGGEALISLPLPESPSVLLAVWLPLGGTLAILYARTPGLGRAACFAGLTALALQVALPGATLHALPAGGRYLIGMRGPIAIVVLAALAVALACLNGWIPGSDSVDGPSQP